MSKDLLEVDTRLKDSSMLWRTLDFYSAANIVTDERIAFSRADTFPDRNEGIELLLRQIQAMTPDGGCGGMGWTTSETAKARHAELLQNHFVSCWSQTEESVAMWSLYSPDHCSVRISTTVGKLRFSVEAFLEKHTFARLGVGDIGKSVVIATSGTIAPVEYASLVSIEKRVTRHAKAHERILERYARKGMAVPKLNELDHRYFKREHDRRINELRDTCRLKDLSFKHESEVRAVVRLGEEPWNESSMDYQTYLNRSQEYHVALKEILKLWQFASNARTQEREYVACLPNFIDTIAIDPRCPPHKSHFIRQWFSNRGIRVVESNCFGYLPERFSVFPVR